VRQVIVLPGDAVEPVGDAVEADVSISVTAGPAAGFFARSPPCLTSVPSPTTVMRPALPGAHS
jgi:hypothetical protein